MNCKYCGMKLDSDEKRCSNCGALVPIPERPTDKELYQQDLKAMEELESFTNSLYKLSPQDGSAFGSAMKILVFLFSGVLISFLLYNLGIFDNLLYWFGG